MQKILLISAIFIGCCVLLSGCSTTSQNAAPKMKSHTSRVEKLKQEYETKYPTKEVTDKDYSYEDKQLKINLK